MNRNYIEGKEDLKKYPGKRESINKDPGWREHGTTQELQGQERSSYRGRQRPVERR